MLFRDIAPQYTFFHYKFPKVMCFCHHISNTGHNQNFGVKDFCFVSGDLEYIYILKWKSLSHVRLFVIRIKERVTFTFSRGSSQPRDWTQVSHTAGGLFTSWATREAQEYRLEWVVYPSLLQQIFPTQERNQSLLHCSWILYHLSHQGSPRMLKRVAYPFSRGSSWLRNWTGVSCITDG